MSATEEAGTVKVRKHPDLMILCSGLGLALGGVAFLLIAAAMQMGGTQSVDDWTLKAVRALVLKDPRTGQVYGEEAVIAITSLGALVILIGVSCLVMGLLWLTQRRQVALLLLTALLGAIGINYSLKYAFNRPRPQVVQLLQRVDTKSFPSGHALTATAIYATLGAIGATVCSRRSLKVYVMSGAVGVSILVGLSRVYLGVHYPSDVLAGWIVGFTWALLCWLTARRLKKRGA